MFSKEIYPYTDFLRIRIVRMTIVDFHAGILNPTQRVLYRNPKAMDVLSVEEEGKNLNDPLPTLSLDAVLKDFFQSKERLADLLNAALLMVETIDSDSSSLIEVDYGRFNTTKRLRDKLFRIRLDDDIK